VLLFFVGLAGRRCGVLQPRHGGALLRHGIVVGLPALFLANVTRMTLAPEVLWLPAIAIFVMLVCLAVAALSAPRVVEGRGARGAFLISAMALNGAFLFPFVLAGWGGEAFALLALFDLGNALMVCTVMYVLAAAYGGHAPGPGGILRRMLGFPPLWALLAALLLNLGSVPVPSLLLDTAGWLGRVVLLGVIVALGILFDHRRLALPATVAVVTIRVLVGIAAGWLAVAVLDLQGLPRAVVLLGSAAPIGFNVVLVAEREGLDREFAASAASLSVALGLVYVPVGLWLLRDAAR
jgi:predicted permease